MEFSELVRLINKKEQDMKKSKSGAGKNKAIKSGNPAFKPTNNGSTLPKGGKGSLNNSMWRGTSRGK